MMIAITQRCLDRAATKDFWSACCKIFIRGLLQVYLDGLKVFGALESELVANLIIR
jgi:hypothetical protein